MLQRPVFGYHPDSGQFAMVIGGEAVAVWALGEGHDAEEESRGMVRPERGLVKGVGFASETTLVTVHEKGIVAGWELESIAAGEPESVWEIELEMTVATARASDRDGAEAGEVALGGIDGEVALLRSTGQEPPAVARIPSAHADKIEVLTFSSDGSRLATSGRDREIGVWSTRFDVPDEGEATLDEVCRLTGSDGWPLCVAFSSDGSRLASGCMDNGTYIWDLKEGERTGVCREHHGWVEDIEWLSGDHTVVTASWDETVGVFQAAPLRPRLQFMHHDDYVVRVLPVPGTPLVLAASYDATVTVWNCRVGKLEGVLKGHNDWVTELVWVGNERFLSLSSDRTARLWSLRTMSEVAAFGDSVIQAVDRGSDSGVGDFGPSGGSSWTSMGSSLEAESTPLVRRFDPDDPMVSQTKLDTASALPEDAPEGAESREPEPESRQLASESDVVGDKDWDRMGEEPSQSGLGEELSSMVLDAISDAEDEAEESDRETRDDTAEAERGDDVDSEAGVDEAEDDAPQRLAAENSSGVSEDEKKEAPGEVDEHIEDGAGLTPTSSPDYDPQPLESPEEVQEFLPDDEILDLAFPHSADEAVEESESEESESEESESEESESEESESEAPEAESREPESEPESESGSSDSGDGNSPWSRDKASGTATRGKPLTSGDEEGGAEISSAGMERPRRTTPQGSPGLRDSEELRIGKIDPPRPNDELERIGNRTQTPFTEPSHVENDDASEDSEASEEDDDETDTAGKVGGASSNKQSLLQRMARNLGTRKEEVDGGDGEEASTDEDDDQEADETTHWLPDFGAKRSEKKERTPTRDGGPKPAESESGDSAVLGAPTLKTDASAKPGASTLKTDASPDAPAHTTTSSSGPSPFSPADDIGSIDDVGDSDDAAKGEMAMPAEKESPDDDDDEAHGREGARVDIGGDGSPDSGGAMERSEDSAKQSGDADELLFAGQPIQDANQTFMGRPGAMGVSPGSDVETVKQQRDGDGDHSSSPSTTPGLKLDSSPGKEPIGAEKTPGGLNDEDTATDLTAQTGSSGEDDDASVTLISFDELWERAKAVPQMGILRRRIDAGVAYDPAYQLMTGMRDEVAIAVSSQEKRLVTAGTGGKMAAWSIGGESEVKCSIPDSRWMDVGFAEGERLGYAVDGEGRVGLWLIPSPGDSNQETIYFAIFGESQLCYRCGCLDEEREILAVGTEEGQALLWNVKSGRCEVILEGHEAAVSAVAFGRKGPVTASVDGQIRFWNRQGFQFDQIDISGEIVDVAASGGWILWTETSGALRLMEEGASNPMKLQGHYGEGRSVAFREDGYAVAGGEDGRLLVYDGNEGEMAQEVPIPAPIHRVIMKRKVLAASCVGGTVFVFRRVEKK